MLTCTLCTPNHQIRSDKLAAHRKSVRSKPKRGPKPSGRTTKKERLKANRMGKKALDRANKGWLLLPGKSFTEPDSFIDPKKAKKTMPADEFDQLMK